LQAVSRQSVRRRIPRWQSFTGCLLASICSFVVMFLLLPTFSEVELLMLTVGVFVFVGGYIVTFPRFTPLGLAFNLYFAYILSPTNRCFALLFGIAVVIASFLLIFPHEGKWAANQHTRHLRELLLHAATGLAEWEVSAQIAATMRDLIIRLNTLPNLTESYREAARNWAFGAFWIANTLVQVRHYSAIYADLMPLHWAKTEQQWLDAVTAVAWQDTREATEAAVRATRQAIAALEAPGEATAKSPKRDLALFSRASPRHRSGDLRLAVQRRAPDRRRDLDQRAASVARDLSRSGTLEVSLFGRPCTCFDSVLCDRECGVRLRGAALGRRPERSQPL
jgi:fusaric acid resistance family protein